MKLDLINGLFEFIGACLIWLNIVAIQRDKAVKGFRLLPLVFFTSWGFWNLFYYPHLHQPWSFAGGVFMFLTNFIYISWVVRYR